jgi:hypothetical protein
MSGKINASEFLRGLFISSKITIKKRLLAKVADENIPPTLYWRFSSENAGVFIENASHVR